MRRQAGPERHFILMNVGEETSRALHYSCLVVQRHWGRWGVLGNLGEKHPARAFGGCKQLQPDRKRRLTWRWVPSRLIDKGDFRSVFTLQETNRKQESSCILSRRWATSSQTGANSWHWTKESVIESGIDLGSASEHILLFKLSHWIDRKKLLCDYCFSFSNLIRN